MSNHWKPSFLPDDLILSTLGHLALFLGGSEDSFTGDLLRLIAKADLGNRQRLMNAFPREVIAWEIWQVLERQGHAPPAGRLAHLLDLADEPAVRTILQAIGPARILAEIVEQTGRSPAADQVPDIPGGAAGDDGEPGQGVAEPLQEP